MNKKLTIDIILKFLEIKNNNIVNRNQYISNFSSLVNAKKGDFTFCSISGLEIISTVKSSTASLILCPLKLKSKLSGQKNIIFVDNPRLTFIRCLTKFYSYKLPKGIDSTAIVKTKKIGKNVSIGPFCYVAKDVIIGDNVTIYGNVYIYDQTKIGNNIIIHASTVIGSDGFGFALNEKNEYEKFIHIGGVEIHDNVEIGASNCIDKGTLQNTIIGKGTKTDNLVHIAHNVRIGKNCLLTAGVTTSGSCNIGDNVYIGTAATLRDWINVGKNSFIGIGSVVVKDVPDGITVMGIPAKPYKKTKLTH
jgi:UDP-3-O-[3-hydroxymyristoyl] glucosamine N-acyltransferase